MTTKLLAHPYTTTVLLVCDCEVEVPPNTEIHIDATLHCVIHGDQAVDVPPEVTGDDNFNRR